MLDGDTTPEPRHVSERVTSHLVDRDHTAMLLASAAANPAVSDAALRVYTVIVTAFQRTIDAPTVAKVLPQVSEGTAAHLLGRLVTAGLLRKNGMRTVAKDEATGKRTRCSVYTLVGGGVS
jgi:succinate dehydrogenase hydrophobic anchor subunit